MNIMTQQTSLTYRSPILKHIRCNILWQLASTFTKAEHHIKQTSINLVFLAAWVIQSVKRKAAIFIPNKKSAETR